LDPDNWGVRENINNMRPSSRISLSLPSSW
jgi:hypothetical protein